MQRAFVKGSLRAATTTKDATTSTSSVVAYINIAETPYDESPCEWHARTCMLVNCVTQCGRRVLTTTTLSGISTICLSPSQRAKCPEECNEGAPEESISCHRDYGLAERQI